MDICVDFDGTCVKHEYPKIGADIGAIPVLKELVDAGHNLILFTMRSGNELAESVEWFSKNEIKLYGINTNPSQSEWTKSPKAYGQIYIDDAAIGCPLMIPNMGERPYVNWDNVRIQLVVKGALSPKKILKSRCCGRCDGINDLCVSDMTCDDHNERGCEICYGEITQSK